MRKLRLRSRIVGQVSGLWLWLWLSGDEVTFDFAKKGLEAEFIAADLLAYEPKENYDFVICQSVLRHIPEYPKVLQKMADSACAGGLVVCMEVNRRIENAGNILVLRRMITKSTWNFSARSMVWNTRNRTCVR